MKLLKLENKKGAMGILGTISTVVIVGVFLMVGLLTYSKVSGSIDQSSFSAAENTTMANIRTNVLSGFDLSAIVTIVAAAAAILGLIATAFALFR